MNVLPSDIDLEKSIIAHSFQNGVIFDNVAFDDFYFMPHQNMWNAITSEKYDVSQSTAQMFKFHLDDLRLLIEQFEDSYVNHNSIKNLLDLSFRRKTIIKHQEALQSCFNLSEQPEDIFCISRLSKTEMKTKEEVTSSVKKQINEFSPVSFRFNKLNQKIPSIGFGNVVCIAGRSGTGKSAFAIQLVQSIASEQMEEWAFFSIEMPELDVVQRYANIKYWENLKEQGDEVESNKEWIKFMKEDGYVESNLPDEMLFCDESHLTIRKLRASIKKLIAKRPSLRNVLIDYLQLVTGEGKTRNEEIGKIARELKAIAKEFNLRMFYISQLSRKAEDGSIEPYLHHLRDSGDIEEACDIILFLWRPHELEQNLMLKIGKYRMGGANTWCPLKRYGVYFEDPQQFEIEQWRNKLNE